MKPQLLTQNGHNMFEMISLLQKAIRRGHDAYAGYAACQLMVRYRKQLWNRLLIISAEDCWDCVTHEIVALRKADEMNPQPLFVARAVTILLRARKNRDADWFACNLLNCRETLDLAECERNFDRIPAYVYDCHTWQGKRAGKTKADMIRDEQKALYPYVEGYYDRLDWSRFFYCEKNGFYDKNNIAPMPTKEQMKELDAGAIQQDLFG